MQGRGVVPALPVLSAPDEQTQWEPCYVFPWGFLALLLGSVILGCTAEVRA